MEVGIVIQSIISKQMADEEFALLEDQKHFEKVWSIMRPNVEKYVDDFLISVSDFGNLGVMDYAYSAFVKELIDKNKKNSDKYHDIFDLELFEDEYRKNVKRTKE